MFGSNTLPGVAIGTTYREVEGSIWRGYIEATWVKPVKISSDETISVGTILKEDLTDGSYSPIAVTDIVSSVSDLPGARLGIVADSVIQDDGNVLIGISGQVDRDKLLVGENKFTDLTEAQQITLNTQLEIWNFQLVTVTQA